MSIIESTPTSFLWVSPDGFDSNDGSSSSPLATIQAAADRAAPGTAVLVRAGEYRENIKIPSSGTEDQPIWFVSVDGAGEANVKPQDQNLATFLGRGTDNIIIKDFAIDGADNRSGIEFTQSGVDFTNLVKNIVIEGNIIYDAGIDGIKIAQTENIQVIGNKISGGREEGIDFVTVWNATIAHNEVEDTQGPGGIVVKGGSNAIVIENNYVHDTAVDGIIVGGWTDAELFQIFQGFEASQITVRENVVEDVGKRPLNFLAAQDSTATNNFLDPNNDYFTIVNIEGDNLGLVSRDLTITDNTVTKENWIFVTPGHDQGHVIQNNSLGQSHTNLVGPEHQLSSQPTWLSNIRKAKADPTTDSSQPDDNDQIELGLITSLQLDQAFNDLGDAVIMDHQNQWQLDQGTIEFTFSTNDATQAQGILSKDATFFGEGGHLTARVEDEKLIVRLQSEKESYTVETGEGSIRNGEDHHVAVSFGSEGLKLIFDGDLVDSNDYAGGLAGNREPLVLGASAVFSDDLQANRLTEALDGTIKDVAIYDYQQPHDEDEAPDDTGSNLITSLQLDQAFNDLGDAVIMDHQNQWQLDQGTIEFTFSTNDATQAQGILSKDATFFGEGGHLTARVEDEKLIVRLQSEKESYTVETGEGSIRNGEDHHVAVSFGSEGLKLIFDGDLVDSNDYAGGLAGNREPLVLGASAVFSDDLQANRLTEALDGTIKDVAIYDYQQPHDEDEAPDDTGSNLITSLQLDQAFNDLGDAVIMDHQNQWQLDQGTIEFTFSTNDATQAQGILSKDATFFGEGGHLTARVEDEKLIVRLQSEKESYTVETGEGSIRNGEDHHVAVSFGSEGLKLIFDGDLVDSNDYAGGLAGNREPLVLGASAVFSDDLQANRLTEALDGTIKDVAIYDYQQPHDEDEAPDDTGSNLITSLQLDQAFNDLGDAVIMDHQNQWQLDQGTIEFTFSTNDATQAQGILSKDATFFGEGGHLTARVEDEKLIVRLQSEKESYTVETGEGSIRNGEDHHVAVSFGSEGLKLIFDGDLVDSNDYAGGLAGNREPLVLGASAVFSDDLQANRLTEALDGTIKDVAVYDRGLSDDALALLTSSDFTIGEDTLLDVFDSLTPSVG